MAAELAVEQALGGDFAPLVERLRTATVLLVHEREVAADIIDRKIRRPRRRPPGPGTQTKNLVLALKVAALMSTGMVRKAAVAKTAEDNGEGVSTVDKAVTAHPELASPSLALPRRSNKRTAARRQSSRK